MFLDQPPREGITTPNAMLLGSEGASRELRLCKGPVVPERGDHPPRLGDRLHIDACTDDSDTLAGVGEDLAPGIDDQRMAIGSPALGMLAPLRRCKDEASILDRPRLHQHLPVRLAGR